MGNTDSFVQGLVAQAPFEVPSPATETLAFFNTWARYEGTQARNNPLADTLPQGGSTVFNSAGVQDYPSVAVAQAAYCETFRTVPAYAPIIAAVRSNGPFQNAAVADALDAWGTHGFATHLRDGLSLSDDYDAPSLSTGPAPPPPAPAPTPPSPAPAGRPTPGQSYVSEPGDSFWKMASEAYGDGSDWPAIWQANGGSAKYPDPSVIPAGASFVIPELGAPAQAQPPAPPPPPSLLATVTVTPGETLWAYAKHYYGNGALFPRISSYPPNDAKYPSLANNPGLIDVGWVLEIPAA